MTYDEKILEKARNLKLVVFDVDGVFTDNKIWISGDGDEFKMFNTHDGFGLKSIRRQGIDVAIISGRKSNAVSRRMTELSIEHVFQGISDKLPVYEKLRNELGIEDFQCAYVGDDVPDIPMIERVGLGIAVANATEPVKQVADWQTNLRGGEGAVREVCDLIVHAYGFEVGYGA